SIAGVALFLIEGSCAMICGGLPVIAAAPLQGQARTRGSKVIAGSRSPAERPRDPEAEIAVPDDDGIRAAIGRAEDIGIAAPGTATNDTIGAVAGGPGRPVRRRAMVVVLEAILHPFPHVAEHVVQAERIGGER